MSWAHACLKEDLRFQILYRAVADKDSGIERDGAQPADADYDDQQAESKL